jgi:hypothetical protein
MPPINIHEGRFYRGRNDFLRKVIRVEGKVVQWRDRYEAGECLMGTFRTWAVGGEVAADDPEAIQLDELIRLADAAPARTARSYAREIQCWNSFREMRDPLRKLYIRMRGPFINVRWMCWVPTGRLAPAFCHDPMNLALETGKGIFYVRPDTKSEAEIVAETLEAGRAARETGSQLPSPRTFKRQMGIEDRRHARALYNVLVAGYNSIGAERFDAHFAVAATGVAKN